MSPRLTPSALTSASEGIRQVMVFLDVRGDFAEWPEPVIGLEHVICGDAAGYDYLLRPMAPFTVNLHG